MSSLVIAGDSSGQITLAAPAVSGTTTLTLPATTGTVLNDATVGVCRAWVNFNGTGTVAIRASFNVSSITDNGTGDYTANFTTAMTDASYSTLFMAPSADIDFHSGVVNETKSTANTRITISRLSYISSAYFDYSQINIAIFR